MLLAFKLSVMFPTTSSMYPTCINYHFSVEESSFSIEESLKNLHFYIKTVTIAWFFRRSSLSIKCSLSKNRAGACNASGTPGTPGSPPGRFTPTHDVCYEYTLLRKSPEESQFQRRLIRNYASEATIKETLASEGPTIKNHKRNACF